MYNFICYSAFQVNAHFSHMIIWYVCMLERRRVRNMWHTVRMSIGVHPCEGVNKVQNLAWHTLWTAQMDVLNVCISLLEWSLLALSKMIKHPRITKGVHAWSPPLCDFSTPFVLVYLQTVPLDPHHFHLFGANISKDAARTWNRIPICRWSAYRGYSCTH